jgi:D-amino-acid dehydrogenase
VRVSVVGGGVIGLGVAYELARSGADVVVLERARLGCGASLGNAGWVSPALSASPVPGPGVTAQVLRWMIRSDSPFLLRPRIDRAFVGWLWSFQRACRAPQYAAGMRALVDHNRHAIDSLLRWRRQGVEFELHRSGLIFAALTQAALHEERELYVRLRAAGFPVDFELVDAHALREREPAISDRVIGGMLSRAEWHLRPESLTAGLAAALRRAGAELLEGAVVEELAPEDGGWRLSTSTGSHHAERVVLATGAWGRSLVGPLGYRLPLEAAKGYSITAAGDGIRPRHAVYLLEAKVGCSPYADAVRLAGTLELAGLDLSRSRDIPSLAPGRAAARVGGTATPRTRRPAGGRSRARPPRTLPLDRSRDGRRHAGRGVRVVARTVRARRTGAPGAEAAVPRALLAPWPLERRRLLLTRAVGPTRGRLARMAGGRSDQPVGARSSVTPLQHRL